MNTSKLGKLKQFGVKPKKGQITYALGKLNILHISLVCFTCQVRYCSSYRVFTRTENYLNWKQKRGIC